MKIKIYSLHLGYREADAKIEKDAKGRHVLVVDGVGPVSALDYIKQGMKLLSASEHEVTILKQAGYPMKNELI